MDAQNGSGSRFEMRETQTEEYVHYEKKDYTRVHERGRRENTPHKICTEERNFSSLDMPKVAVSGRGWRVSVETLLRMEPFEQGFEWVLVLWGCKLINRAGWPPGWRGPAPQGDTEVGARWTPAHLPKDPGLRCGWLHSLERSLCSDARQPCLVQRLLGNQPTGEFVRSAAYSAVK